MKTKLIALILASLMCLNTVALTACAREDAPETEDTTIEGEDSTIEDEDDTSDMTESEDITEIDEGMGFTFDASTQTYSVIDYTGTAASVIIPDTYEGYPVTSIGSYAFEDCDSLTSVTFENKQGWTAGGTAISSTDLESTSTAATYLKSTYYDRTWTRS